jgi:hypothetical protein
MAALVISLTILVAAYAAVAVAMRADRKPYPGRSSAAADSDPQPARDAARPVRPDVRPTGAAAVPTDESVLAAWRLSGYLSAPDYRQAMERLAAEDDLRHPLAAPPNENGAT